MASQRDMSSTSSVEEDHQSNAPESPTKIQTPRTPISARERRNANTPSTSSNTAGDGRDEWSIGKTPDGPPLAHQLRQAEIPVLSPRSAKASVGSPKRHIQTPASRFVDDKPAQTSTEPSNRRVTPPDSMSLSTSSPIKFIDHDNNNSGAGAEAPNSRHVSGEYGMSPNAINLKEKHSPVREAMRDLKHPDTDKIFGMDLEIEKKEKMDREQRRKG